MASRVPPRLRGFWAIALAYAALLFAWSALRHAHYGSHAYDLGAYHQTFYNLGRHGSLWSPIEEFHSWSSHLEIGLLPIGLLYRLAPSPLWLFALQALGCAACAAPIELLARRYTGDARLALICALATLLTPQLLFASIYDFHSVTMCALPVALLVVGVELDALFLVVVGAALALSLREQMGIAVMGAAAGWAVRHGPARRNDAAALAFAGLTVFFVEVVWLIPSFARDGTFRHLASNYAFGGSPRAMLAYAIAHPLRFASLPFEGKRRLLYPIALASGAVLPVLVGAARAGRRLVVPALALGPLLLVQLYSARVLVFSVESHYGAPLVPIVGVAAVIAIGGLSARSRRLAFAAALGWLLVTMLHALIAVAPLAWRPGGPLDPSFAGSPRAAALARVTALVPDDCTVSAQDTLTPHLTGDVHVWPKAEGVARFVVVDANEDPGPDAREPVRDAEERLRRDPRFVVRVDEAGVLLVERLGLGF